MSSSASGDIRYSMAEIEATARMWHRASAQLARIGAMVQAMTVRGNPRDSELFPNSIVKYTAILSNIDASCQEGAAIADAIGDTLHSAALVYNHADQEAQAATRALAQKIQDLGRLP